MEAVAAFFNKYLWVILYVAILSIAGGISSYIRKRKAGLIARFKLGEFVGDMFISAFVGVLTYFICKGVGLNELLTAAAIGITSHMGTRAIIFAEDLIPEIVNKYFKLK